MRDSTHSSIMLLYIAIMLFIAFYPETPQPKAPVYQCPCPCQCVEEEPRP